MVKRICEKSSVVGNAKLLNVAQNVDKATQSPRQWMVVEQPGNSVTSCWNKKWPKISKQCPKSSHNSFTKK